MSRRPPRHPRISSALPSGTVLVPNSLQRAAVPLIRFEDTLNSLFREEQRAAGWYQVLSSLDKNEQDWWDYVSAAHTLPNAHSYVANSSFRSMVNIRPRLSVRASSSKVTICNCSVSSPATGAAGLGERWSRLESRRRALCCILACSSRLTQPLQAKAAKVCTCLETLGITAVSSPCACKAVLELRIG